MTEPDKHDTDDLDLELDLQLDALDVESNEFDVKPAPTTPPTMAALDVGSGMTGASAPAPAPAFAPASPEQELRATGFAGMGASSVAESAGAAAAGAAPAVQEDGMWVWQYGAPPPPAPFSSAFFAGRALAELYRFFACGLLVFIGCLLPWGKSLAWVVEHGESTLGYAAPPAGYEVPIGAVCLALAVWLMFAACYGIYTGRQKIMPVFLMLVPAWVTWARTLEAFDLVADLPFKLRLEKLFEVAGSGVLLTLVGSTIMAASLLIVIVKVFKKRPEDAATPRPRKADAKGDAKADAKAGDATAADKSKDAAAAADGGRKGRKR